MNELRWILIGFGIVVLALIYLWGRRSARSDLAQDTMLRTRPEPSLGVQEPSSFGARGSDRGFEDEVAASSTEGPPRAPARSADLGAESPASSPQPDRALHDTWRGRLEPTLTESAPTEELPVRAEATAPTLSSSEAPQSRRIDRRKILSLRLAVAPQRIDGGKLLETFEAESLTYGKYQIFHRLHEDGASIVFSAASMVEPGTFDPEKMRTMQFPGLTLFAQLPGPTPGMHALNELVACARKLQQALGGTLQDERGVPLTVHRIERLRQEVREFERPSARAGG